MRWFAPSDDAHPDRRRHRTTDELWSDLVTAWENFEDDPNHWTARALLEANNPDP
jgi:hypothetical protein